MKTKVTAFLNFLKNLFLHNITWDLQREALNSSIDGILSNLMNPFTWKHSWGIHSELLMNSSKHLLFVYVSFANMLAYTTFLHMMLCFEIVLWCRWKVTKCSSYRNTLMRWHDRIVFKTFWCELVVAYYACYCFLFLWPFECPN